MKEREVKRELAKLASGRYCSFSHETIIYSKESGGRTENSYTMYIEGGKLHSGLTWGEALERVKEECQRDSK